MFTVLRGVGLAWLTRAKNAANKFQVFVYIVMPGRLVDDIGSLPIDQERHMIALGSNGCRSLHHNTTFTVWSGARLAHSRQKRRRLVPGTFPDGTVGSLVDLINVNSKAFW